MAALWWGVQGEVALCALREGARVGDPGWGSPVPQGQGCRGSLVTQRGGYWGDVRGENPILHGGGRGDPPFPTGLDVGATGVPSSPGRRVWGPSGMWWRVGRPWGQWDTELCQSPGGGMREVAPGPGGAEVPLRISLTLPRSGFSWSLKGFFNHSSSSV